MDFSVENIDLLIEELMKSKPDQKRVKVMMEKAGLKYSTNYIEQMNTVLRFISSPKLKSRGKQKVAEI